MIRVGAVNGNRPQTFSSGAICQPSSGLTCTALMMMALMIRMVRFLTCDPGVVTDLVKRPCGAVGAERAHCDAVTRHLKLVMNIEEDKRNWTEGEELIKNTHFFASSLHTS